MKIPGVLYNAILVAVFWLAEYLFGAQAVGQALDQVQVWTGVAVVVITGVLKAYEVFKTKNDPEISVMGQQPEGRVRRFLLG